MSRTALVVGHTGLVGRHLLRGLLDDARYTAVTALGRRAPAIGDPKLQVIQHALDDLRGVRGQLAADDAFCCLGTTIKTAGSKAAFERVDFHMVVDFARAAREAGARRFFLVSSLSASSRSPIYYSRVKGRTEQAVMDIGFETLHILRPSLLLGARDEQRPGEAVAQRLAPVFNALIPRGLRHYRAVSAEDVARALLALAGREAPGTWVHTLPLD